MKLFNINPGPGSGQNDQFRSRTRLKSLSRSVNNAKFYRIFKERVHLRELYDSRQSLRSNLSENHRVIILNRGSMFPFQ